MSNSAAIAGIKADCFRHHLAATTRKQQLATKIVIAKYATCPSLGG